jgi:hypothetical protein
MNVVATSIFVCKLCLVQGGMWTETDRTNYPAIHLIMLFFVLFIYSSRYFWFI